MPLDINENNMLLYIGLYIYNLNETLEVLNERKRNIYKAAYI